MTAECTIVLIVDSAMQNLFRIVLCFML